MSNNNNTYDTPQSEDFLASDDISATSEFKVEDTPSCASQNSESCPAPKLEILVTTNEDKKEEDKKEEYKKQEEELQIAIKKAEKSNLEYMEPSKYTTYTIKKGTTLYHGSTSKETFNPYNIKLGSSSLVVFFSPDKQIASNSFGSCAFFPEKDGFLHMFKVKEDITNIIILSVFDLDKTYTNEKFEDSFCSRKNKYEMALSGVGFFYPSDKKEGDHECEFALCDPARYLKYEGTQRCTSRQRLGDIYSFTK